LCHNFNKLWINALLQTGRPFTHFAMLHDDVEVSPRWISTLLGEMERTGADLMSVVIPIKNNHGLTSTGYGDPGDWYDYRRLTMREVFRLPETFSLDDLPKAKAAGKCLLVNTGCWIADLRRTQYRLRNPLSGEMVFRFWQDHRLSIWPDGTACPEFAPEDWNWSRLCHQHGLKVFATRKVKAIHHGNCPYPNTQEWGDETDTEMDGFLKSKQEAFAMPVADILKNLNARKDKCLV
jgi:hypothetical protein